MVFLFYSSLIKCEIPVHKKLEYLVFSLCKLFIDIHREKLFEIQMKRIIFPTSFHKCLKSCLELPKIVLTKCIQ